jgi:hypothetical protein
MTGDQGNGLRRQVEEHERRITKTEGDIEKIRTQFPNTERCDDHKAQLGRLFARAEGIEDREIPLDDWKEVKADVMALKLKTGWMMVVLSAVIIVANMVAATFIKSAVDKAFARGAAATEEHR